MKAHDENPKLRMLLLTLGKKMPLTPRTARASGECLARFGGSINLRVAEPH
jgi:hypothetical protein